ncbi:hypothetical protein EXIGLDRAFT_603291 [Exidia glandulosa HHB12029]|uniref:C2H2-type domain-containing protein n=1 Tax=Exidia glandulosa HHB12029 TaxID=1314781 RepID=A0A165NUZ3_EXIGL|nr:hypothetical protein EXIGLDRAFT_603291 [Exidia glandulosa HHB12029]
MFQQFQPQQQQWNGGPKVELPDDQLLQQDQRSQSSASSSPGLPHHLAGSGNGYNTTPSPPPQSSSQQQKTFAFIALPGNQVRKRPRRRYDEIERLYPCSWPNCNKSYGTLNHLNAHVTMQRHGEKRSPNEFKEMRKQWRKQKKDEAALQAMQHAHHHAQYGGMHSHVTPPRRDLNSPSSLGFPSPTEFSPIDGENGMPPGVSVMPRRMSLPNLGLNGLGLDVSPPPPMPQFPHGGMNLPSLNLAPIPPQDFWMQQHAPQSAPPHQLSFLHEPLHLPQQRLPHDSTLLTPLQRSDD